MKRIRFHENDNDGNNNNGKLKPSFPAVTADATPLTR